jgi:hypothetical protein
VTAFDPTRDMRLLRDPTVSLTVQVLQLTQTESPHLFNDFQLVPLADGTVEATTPQRNV